MSGGNALKKVLASDKVSEKLKEVFAEYDIAFDIETGYSPQELKKVLGNYDGLIIRSKTKVTSDVLHAVGPRLRVIGRAGIGVDNIDIDAATARGIVVMNTPLSNTITTAEHAIAMILSTARQIPFANQTMHEGRWEKSLIKGVEVTGKTLGLIGCGNIGSIVSDRAKGLKLKVIVYDPFLTKSKAQQLGVALVDWNFLLANADFISIHTPLTDKTKNLINESTILKMKDEVRIVNCARGGIVNEDDLSKHLKNGKIASAALDVFQKEPLSQESSLMGTPNLILTPHLGASTIEAQERVSLEIAHQIGDYLKSGTVVNGYNVVSLSKEDHQKLLPYKKVASQLGSFIAQVRESAYQKITWQYFGEILNLPTEPLLRVGLKNLMKGVVESVNEVNSLYLAKERGIAVEEIKNQNSLKYKNLLSLKVLTEKKEISLTATLFAGVPQIISINEVSIQASLMRHNLYLENRDEPGFIKDLASVLYEEQINIASFHLGRKKKGGKAICLITLDSQPSNDLLEKINQLPLVEASKFIFMD